jgi:hypothetical protein
MLFAGAVTLGANSAGVLTVVADPAGRPFKLVHVGGAFGTVTQDRMSGVAARLGTVPSGVPIASTVRAPDIHRTRQSMSWAVAPGWVASTAANHVYENILSTLDESGEGSASARWLISGHRADGSPFQLARGDRFASRWGVEYTVPDELYYEIGIIESNPLERVRIDRVRVNATVVATYHAYTIGEAQVSVNGSEFQPPDGAALAPGDELTVRVRLDERYAASKQLDIELTVPEDASGDGTLDIVGGADEGGDGSACDEDPSACPTSFDDLLASITSRPHQDEVLVGLVFSDGEGDGGEGEGVAADGGEPGYGSARTDAIVSGRVQYPVTAGSEE